MLSPEEDQDGNGIFDQLRSIKPFTVDQLYLLHPDVCCPPKSALSNEDNNANDHEQKFHIPQSDKEIYQNLVEHEQLKNRLIELKHDIKKLHKGTHDHVDKAWTLKEESARRIALCQQGKIAETTFKYKRAHIDKKQLEMFSKEFAELIDLITKDYIYYSFESQMKRNKIATQLSVSYQLPDLEIRKAKLKAAIVTLIEFIKYLGDIKSNFVFQCRKWLRALCKRYLADGTTDDHRFIISQLARGPVGTADWSADLIECKPYEQVSSFDSVPQYITHCSTLLSELFYSLQLRIKHISATTLAPTTNTNQNDEAYTNDRNDQNWSLVDPRFNCTEELSVSANFCNLLSETDVIKFCLKIPVAQIFRAYVKKCLDSSDEFRLETDKNYEFIMLKLLTIGTIIIKTYQIGLETFNSIQYGSLIEYQSSQIRRTVIILSDQWSEFRRRLRGIDDALLMRLQVEYDNFMLRSILVILELRQSGIWRHLSRKDRDLDESPNNANTNTWSTDSLIPAFAKLLHVTGISMPPQLELVASSETAHVGQQHQSASQPSAIRPLSHRSSSSLTYEFSIEWFKDVSEPMLWHILWQFYHNAFVSSCDYHSDNYWLEKFQEKSVVYLFVNKMKDSPPGECSYLLNSITSMLLSRTRPDSKLVLFIATEIFNLTFKHKSLREKISRKGIKSLIRCAEKFPSLISLYISLMDSEDGIDDSATNLVRGCSLTGWLCNEDEFQTLESWLIEFPLEAAQNKISRLIISKILLNSSGARASEEDASGRSSRGAFHKTSKRKGLKRVLKQDDCFVELKLRRKLALTLYHASTHHLPENSQFGPQSLGASVETAFGVGLFCDASEVGRNSLLELATDPNYQQFYIWTWRILFTLRLHILNQSDTDWNDVQSRSGTSRSIKNTVLVNDLFHPVPSIEDSECSALSEGIRNMNPVASFVYLFLADVTWQVDTVESCLTHLNILANSGHITPSLMAMKFFSICHLNDLLDVLAKDKKCIEYFTNIILSNFDANRLASLIVCQLDHLKQYRQLQLSHFYISVFLEVSTVISKQISASWFSSNEISLEKIACLLDYLVRFNFATQRNEIIRKFYDCAYVIQDQHLPSTNGWLGTFLTSTSSPHQRDFLTNLHNLAQKFSKKYTWLQWVTTECDTLRLEKIWEDIVAYLSSNEEANLDSAIKKFCPHINSNLLKATLPIFSWIRQIFDIMETDLSHPLCPLIWYNFFLNYFANSLNGVSVGVKLVSQETLARLMTRLDSLYNYHLFKQRNWSSSSALQQNSLTQLYRAYRLWLQDPSLRDAYIDIDRLKDDYLVPILKAVMESSNASACLQYVDLESIATQNKNLIQVWIASTRLSLNDNQALSGDSIMYVDDSEVGGEPKARESTSTTTSVDEDELADDAISLIVKSYNTLPENRTSKSSLDDGHEELSRPLSDDFFGQRKYQTTDELMDIVKQQFTLVFEESTVFGLNISELDRTKSEIIELVQQLYTNKKREFVRVVACAEGHDCSGPARIKFDGEEALMDERKSHCIQDRSRQCQELVGELLSMPKSRSVQATVIIEDTVKRLIGEPERTKMIIETLLSWLSEPSNYSQLNGTYHVANHLLKTVLEILSTATDQIDVYNRTLIDVCLAHPVSVQIFSPYLTPSSCSPQCFLDLYKTICSNQLMLGPMAAFVLLSKFDIGSWLAANANLTHSKNKVAYNELIVTTCKAFRDIGKCSDESNELTMDLFKRHLQIELASPDRRKPDELQLVLGQFLKLMDDQVLAPNLWLDYLNIIGLERNFCRTSAKFTLNNKADSSSVASSPARRDSSNQPPADVSLGSSAAISATLRLSGQLDPSAEPSSSMTAGIADDIFRLAERQSVFDYHSLSAIVKTISEFMQKRHDQTDNVTLLEVYHDYLEQYGITMLSFTYMWLKATSESYPDNHELVWKQFMGIWYNWVFLTKNCQNVGKSSYSLIVNYFVVSLVYMIRKIPDSTQSILQSLLSELTTYIGETREVVYLELTILQRCLKNLPWSHLVAEPADIDHLAALSEQDNYNVSDLVSHIMMQINIKESLARMHQQATDSNSHEVLSQAVERLATIIILQSANLKGYRLYGSYFCLIPSESIQRLSDLVLARMEFVNLEHSQNNKLLVNLLRYTCIKFDLGGDSDNHHQVDTQRASDCLRRSILYSQFVSNYMIDLTGRHPKVTSNHRAYLNAVLDNSLQDLKPLILSSDYDIKQKTTLYRTLLECCSCEVLDTESRLILAMSVVESALLKGRPIVVLEILHAVGQFIRDGRILVLMVEKLVDLYLAMNGHYERVCKSFCLASISADTYLNTCIEERAPLALVVYFESLSSGRQPPLANITPRDHGPTNSEGSTTSAQAARQTFADLSGAQIWPSFLHWLACLTQAMGNQMSGQQASSSRDTKLITAWLRMLKMLEPNLKRFLFGQADDEKASTPRAGSESGGNSASQNGDDGNKSTSSRSRGMLSTTKTDKQQKLATKVSDDHKSLLSLIRQLIALYDSIHAGGLWSYLKSSHKSEHSIKISATSLAIACFLADRALMHLGDNLPAGGGQAPVHLSALCDELAKLRSVGLSKLEAARKSKSLIDYAQFIDTLIESVQQNNKVQYDEVVQLITTFVRA